MANSDTNEQLIDLFDLLDAEDFLENIPLPDLDTPNNSPAPKMEASNENHGRNFNILFEKTILSDIVLP